MNSLISIIVPVYKVEQYLDRCIQSLLRQTYKTLEIILVDDGSPDNCGKMCDVYADMDSRIVVIHKENGGLSDARNAGLKISKGDYIGFVDSDDWISDDMFEILYNGLIDNEADISICGYYKVNSETISTEHQDNTVVYETQDAFRELLLDDNIENYAWNKLYKATLFDGSIYYPIGRHFEDVGTTYKLFLKAKRIVVLPEVKYFYFRHSDSIVGSWNIGSLIDYAWCVERRFYDTKDIYPEYNDLQLTKYWNVLKATLSTLQQVNNEEFNNIRTRVINELIPFAGRYREELIKSGGLGKRNKKKLDMFLTNIDKFMKKKWYMQERRSKIYQKIKWRIKERSVFKPFFYAKDFKKNRLYNLLRRPRTRPLLLVIGAADYNNLGDHAISYAQQKWLQRYFKYSRIIEIYSPEQQKFLREIKKYVNKSDVLLLQGGGNMGDIYPWFEKERHEIVKMFPDNKIIVFPQSVTFNDNEALNKSQQIYNKHKKLYIIAREELSFNLLKEYFPNNKILLTPDIVMSLSLELESYERDGVLLCLRHDLENTLSKSFILDIKKICERKFTKINFTDTVVEKNIPAHNREEILLNKWQEFAQAELVITNRLHGMIFAAITNTPCIAFDNSTHKIKYSYNWLKDLEYIELADSLNDLEEKINNLKDISGCDFHNFSHNADFDKLYNIIAENV